MTEKPFKPLTTDELARQIMMTFPGFKAKTTRRYACVYNTSDEFAAVATRILDTMLPGVKSHMTSLKIAVHEPDVPLLAMMFRTAEEFQRFEKLPAGVQAFYKPSSNTIVMYEESPLFRVNRELAIRQSLATIAHEGTPDSAQYRSAAAAFGLADLDRGGPGGVFRAHHGRSAI